MKLSQPRAGDNAPRAVIEYVDRPGEIRAARPPQKLQDKIKVQGLEQALRDMGIAPAEELVGEDELKEMKEKIQKEA